MNPLQVTAPPSHLILRLYQTPLKHLLGRLVLLLTTTGRKTGLARATPLQYESVMGVYYVGSALGTQADWFRNIVADGHVSVQVQARRFQAVAKPITDPCAIADFLAWRLSRHPYMMRLILHSEGLPYSPSRAQLERYAQKLAMVIIRPIDT